MKMVYLLRLFRQHLYRQVTVETGSCDAQVWRVHSGLNW